jgi:hypothetical protein
MKHLKGEPSMPAVARSNQPGRNGAQKRTEQPYLIPDPRLDKKGLLGTTVI